MCGVETNEVLGNVREKGVKVAVVCLGGCVHEELLCMQMGIQCSTE